MKSLFLFLIKPIIWICELIDFIIFKLSEWDSRFTFYMDNKIDEFFEKRNKKIILFNLKMNYCNGVVIFNIRIETFKG